ncbi:MAG: hypothetical protein NZ761_07595, partial [Dehalococcoidia bacterium]|nr:hypothetical protein [Dehalococcoidia bacterium]
QVLDNGPVAGVSNVVNYDVQFDGSAAFNMPVAQLPAFALSVDPESATNVLFEEDQQHTITATLTFGGEPVEGAPILFEILDGSENDEPGDTDGGTANPTFQLAGDDGDVVATDEDGVASWTYPSDLTGSDSILVCADLNENGVCERATEPWTIVVKNWVALDLEQTYPQQGAPALEAGVGNTIRDWTVRVAFDGSEVDVPILLVLNENDDLDASFAPCNQPDQDVLAATISGSTSYNVWACDYTDDGQNDTVDVELYWDVNGNGVLEDAVDVLIATVTLTLADNTP